MKKFLTAVLLSVMAVTTHAAEKETITIIYGFSAADNSANYSRNLADAANKAQDKYHFVFDVRPGAGQVIAFNYVKNTPNTIFMTSGAYWLRPNFYPTQSYDVNEFRSIMTQCSVPFAIASSKYSNWSDVPTNKRLTIATSGLGVVSHLVALQFQKKYPDSVVVPFKSTTDAILATVGGQTDFVVGFVGDQEKWATENSKVKLHILGATGAKPSGKYQTLASQGFPQSLAKMNTPYTFMVPTSFKEEKAIEIRKILVEAEKAQSVRNSYALDYCAPFQVPENQLKSWWDEQNAFWTSLTVGVKLEQ
jgi:tripartite-type tricarboxylate transporter receptor subunit TctC